MGKPCGAYETPSPITIILFLCANSEISFKLFTDPTIFEQCVTAKILVFEFINLSKSEIFNSWSSELNFHSTIFAP